MKRKYNSYEYLQRRRPNLLMWLIVLLFLMPTFGQLESISAIFTQKETEEVEKNLEKELETEVKRNEEIDNESSGIAINPLDTPFSGGGGRIPLEASPVADEVIIIENLTTGTGIVTGNGWTYNYETKHLVIGQENTYTIQNKADGTIDERTLPFHIEISQAASNVTLIFNNINIKNSYSSSNLTPYEGNELAPLINNASNLNIVLANNTTNTIDSIDPLLTNMIGVRSGIATHAGTLTFSGVGTGTLNVVNGGINFYGGSANGKIIVESGIINVNALALTDVGLISGENMYGGAGIGSGAVCNRAFLNELVVEINGGTLSAIGGVGGAGIGGGSVTNKDNANVRPEHGNLTVVITAGNFTLARGNLGGAGIGSGAVVGNRSISTNNRPLINNVTVNISNGNFVLVDSQHNKTVSGDSLNSLSGAGVGFGVVYYASGNMEDSHFEITITGGLFAKISNDSNSYGAGNSMGVGGYCTGSSGSKLGTIAINIGSENTAGPSLVINTYGSGIGVASQSSANVQAAMINIYSGQIKYTPLSLSGRGIGIGAYQVNGGNLLNLIINITGGSINITTQSVGIGAYVAGSGTSNLNINIAKAGNTNLGINIMNSYSTGAGIGITNLSGLSDSFILNIGNIDELLIRATTCFNLVSNLVTVTITSALAILEFDGNNISATAEARVTDLEGNILITDFIARARTDRVQVAYIVPGQQEAQSTVVRVRQTSSSNWGYFVHSGTSDPVINTAKTIGVVAVDFLSGELPPLWTLTNDREDVLYGNGWRYEYDSEHGDGGVLRIMESGQYVLRNNGEEEPFMPEVPVQIIVAPSASGATLVFDNLDIIRPKLAQSTSALAVELIAPVSILAESIVIKLAANSNNKINGFDSNNEDFSYRTSMYVPINGEVSAYNLAMQGEAVNDVYPTLTLVNGGLNTEVASNTTVTINLSDGNYEFTSNARNVKDGTGLGYSYAQGEVTNMHYNIAIDNTNRTVPMEITITGLRAALGAYGNGTTGTINFGTNVIYTLYATIAEAIINNVNTLIFNGMKIINGRLNLSGDDNWQTLLFRPPNSAESIYWETSLPDHPIYPLEETNRGFCFLYINENLNNNLHISDTNRVALRIERNAEIDHLVRSDGFGSTLDLTNSIESLTIANTLTPMTIDFSLQIPDITLTNNFGERALTLREELVPVVTNVTSLPLQLAIRGYSLSNAPADIENITFLQSVTDLEQTGSDKQLFLGLETGSVNSINVILPPVTKHALIPAEEMIESNLLAILRGQTAVETTTVWLNVAGNYNDAFLADGTNRRFASTIHLRWELLDYANFSE